METNSRKPEAPVLDTATVAPAQTSTDRADVDFGIEDLVRQAFPQAMIGHCSGCNGCSGCSH